MTMGTNWNQPDILSGGPILDLNKVNQGKLVRSNLVQLGSLCEGVKCIIQECLSLILVSVLVGFITRVLEGDPLTSSMGMFDVIFYCNKQCIGVVSLYHWNFHRLKYWCDRLSCRRSVVLSIHVQKSLMCQNFGFIDLRCFPCVLQ